MNLKRQFDLMKNLIVKCENKGDKQIFNMHYCIFVTSKVVLYFYIFNIKYGFHFFPYNAIK